MNSQEPSRENANEYLKIIDNLPFSNLVFKDKSGLQLWNPDLIPKIRFV